MKGRAIVIMAAVWFLSSPSMLLAFSVGQISVESYVGEKFRAEIPLNLGGSERLEDVVVLLGHEKDYSILGAKRPGFIDGLKVSKSEDGRIRLTSEQVMKEPTFDLIVKTSLYGGTILERYTIHLPERLPPLNVVTLEPKSKNPSLLKESLPKGVPTVELETRPIPKEQPRLAKDRLQKYGPVKNGETLFKVARQITRSNQDLGKIVVILWQANRDRFIGQNMNGLKEGAYLDIPPMLQEKLATISSAEATRAIQDQGTEWTQIKVAERDLKKGAILVERSPKKPASAIERDLKKGAKIVERNLGKGAKIVEVDLKNPAKIEQAQSLQGAPQQKPDKNQLPSQQEVALKEEPEAEKVLALETKIRQLEMSLADKVQRLEKELDEAVRKKFLDENTPKATSFAPSQQVELILQLDEMKQKVTLLSSLLVAESALLLGLALFFFKKREIGK
ncbi:MAG: hypothetical protein HY731_08915 [Candidatus Tectomicrobia bacterium]|nr:hypothetical protein [Candidatus Tectomicrobia bacterium]